MCRHEITVECCGLCTPRPEHVTILKTGTNKTTSLWQDVLEPYRPEPKV